MVSRTAALAQRRATKDVTRQRCQCVRRGLCPRAGLLLPLPSLRRTGTKLWSGELGAALGSRYADGELGAALGSGYADGAALGNSNAGSPQQSRTTPPVVGQQSPAREAQCAYALQAAIL